MRTYGHYFDALKNTKPTCGLIRGLRSIAAALTPPAVVSPGSGLAPATLSRDREPTAPHLKPMSRLRSDSTAFDPSSWGGAAPAPEPEPEIDQASVLKKEQIVRDIIVMQEGLRALLERVESVQAEGTKLKTGNETLQTYIDNLTRTNALAAGAGR